MAAPKDPPWRRATSFARAFTELVSEGAGHGDDYPYLLDPEWHLAWNDSARATRCLLVQKAQYVSELGALLWPRNVTCSGLYFPVSRAHLAAIRRFARGRPLAWAGDLDPIALHAYGALQSGDPLRPRFDGTIAYLGVDDRWLRFFDAETLARGAVTLAMDALEREHLALLLRFFPEIRALVGRRSNAILERGQKLEMDAGLTHGDRERLLPWLARRVARVS